MNKITTIHLQGKDTGIIFRDNGKLELYLRKDRGEKNLEPTNNEIITFVLSELIATPGWIDAQINTYENLDKGERKCLK